MNENKETIKNDFCGTTVCTEERKPCEEEVREIYRNLTSGKDSVETLRPMSADSAFREVLLRQDKDYSHLCARVEGYAAENGYDAFTTTLLVSPYQKHDELRKVCEKLAAEAGIEFVYRDFRVGYREGQEKARELGLYRQKYCGCVFSEEDRYRKQIEKDVLNASV